MCMQYDQDFNSDKNYPTKNDTANLENTNWNDLKNIFLKDSETNITTLLK